MRLIAFLLLVPCCYGGTIVASSCSTADVAAAYSSAAANDTVQLPGGTCAWSAQFNITTAKPITLDGQGTTTLTGVAGVSSGGMIEINLGTTGSVRVTGIAFTGQFPGPPYAIEVIGGPTTKYFRLDHLTFNPSPATSGGDTFVNISGNPTGLMDDSSLTSSPGAEIIHNVGFGSGSQTGWTNNVTPGGPNQVYIDTNTFVNSSPNTTNAKAIESYYGAQTVLRHNNFQNNVATDQHGTPGSVGARWWEIYQNTYIAGGFTMTAYAAFRGGSGVYWGNHLSGTFSGGTPGVAMFEEDTGDPACFQVGRGYDPVGGCMDTGATPNTGNHELSSPAYLWGNDSAIQTSISSASGNVAAGTDFYCWQGSSWGATCSSTTTNIGPLTVCEGSSSTGTTSSCSSTLTYAPFTYPYPLDSNGMPDPAGSSAGVSGGVTGSSALVGAGGLR